VATLKTERFDVHDRFIFPGLVLEKREEYRYEVDSLSDTITYRNPVVADEDPPQLVSGEAEVRLELALAEPLADLAGTVLARIEDGDNAPGYSWSGK
jgi:hypothetical protein